MQVFSDNLGKAIPTVQSAESSEKCGLWRFAELIRGTIDGTSVYPREVVKEALAENTAAVIVAHNPYFCHK